VTSGAPDGDESLAPADDADRVSGAHETATNNIAENDTFL
jgi:hypothetical protein